MSTAKRILYCNCTYAQVVPKEVKEAVLKHLAESGTSFEAVADLCELSARKDPALARLSSQGELKVVACFPRAVKWLFAAAGSPLPVESTEIVNMRNQTAADVIANLGQPVVPNVPKAEPKTTAVETVATP